MLITFKLCFQLQEKSIFKILFMLLLDNLIVKTIEITVLILSHIDNLR